MSSSVSGRRTTWITQWACVLMLIIAAVCILKLTGSWQPLAGLMWLMGTTAFMVKAWRVGTPFFGQIYLLLLLLGLLELTCYVLRGRPDDPLPISTVADYPEWHIARYVGAALYADTVYRAVKTFEGMPVYDVHYSIDRHGRRAVPGWDSARSSHVLFFGCSVAFGAGLEDEQTFPSRIQHHARDHNVYNYAYSGWGPHQMLGRLRHHDHRPEVPEQAGLAIYVFLGYHVQRAIGDMFTYCNWGVQDPYYTLRDGVAEQHGNFTDGRPLTSWLYRTLYRSHIIRFFKVQLPPFIRQDHLDLCVALVAQARDRYRAQFGSERFIVLVWPDWEDEEQARRTDWVSARLQAMGIEVLDLRKVISMGEEMRIPNDGHPTALAADTVARITTRMLGLDEP